jgi:hypothetical protein
MNTFFLGLIQQEKERKETRLPFSIGKINVKMEDWCMEFEVSIYQISVDPRIRSLWWIEFSPRWTKNLPLIPGFGFNEPQTYNSKVKINSVLLKVNFPGRNLMLRIEERMTSNLLSLKNEI